MIKLAQDRLVLFAGLILVSLGLAALAAGLALCVQLSVDSLVGGESLSQSAPMLALLFGAIAGGGAILEVFRAWAAERLGLSYVADVRAELFERLLRASQTVLAQRGQGGLLLPFVGDLTALKKWVSDGLVRLISATTSGTLLLGVLAYQSAPLGIVAACIVATSAFVVFLLSKPLNVAIKETRQRRGAVAGFVSRSIRAAGAIQAFHRIGRELKRLDRRNAALVRAGLELALISGATTAVIHVASLSLVVAALGVGALEMRAGALSIGGVVAAISVSGLLAASIRDLGVAFELWRRAAVSYAKIRSALETELAIDPPRARLSPRRSVDHVISLRDVGVQGLFESASADVRRGEIINIVGASGAGKSTLLAIAARLREPDRGRVRICGRDARDLEPATVRGLIGYAGAFAPLLVGSLSMNLSYRVPGATAQDIADIVGACNVGPLLARLPDGVGFRLSEGAPELSAGERQRVQIARAMLGRPLMLILDEVDTHLDDASATRIAGFLTHYPGAVLMAATSPVWVKLATATWRINDHKLEFGHDTGARFEVIDGGASMNGRDKNL